MEELKIMEASAGAGAIRRKGDYRFAPKASRRPSQSFTTNSRVLHGMSASPREIYASGCVLRIECVGVFDGNIGVEQFVPVFIRVGCGRLSAAEVNRLLVAGHDRIDRRILPRPQTFEAKPVFVIGERSNRRA
jgi:hypothetical protein